MLLDVASQLSDPEPLIQKHFFALLSSVSRFSSCNSNRHGLSSFQNALYSYQKTFNSAVNDFSRNFSRETLENMKFTNSSVSGKLVAAALCDDQRAKTDDKVPISKHRDETSVASERLDITLELPHNEHDTIVNLPSVVNLSILGPDSQSSSKTIGEENHLKSYQNLAENRFRYGLLQQEIFLFLIIKLVLSMLCCICNYMISKCIIELSEHYQVYLPTAILGCEMDRE